MSVDQGGMLRPVRMFNAQSRIRETRLEPFSNLAWQATDIVFVDVRLEAEYSKLNQTGPDVTNRRSLFYVRPGLAARFDMAPFNLIRASAQRAIGQLDFADFVTTFETDDSPLGIVNAGNPDLVPEQTWEYALTFERRLARDGGVVTLKAIYNDVTDLIGSVAVEPLRDISAVGNVGKGRQYGIEPKASLRLAGMGLPGVVVNATAIARESNFTDPFTGARVDFEDYPTYAYSLGFRHDTGWRDLSYGATFDGEGTRFDVEVNTVHELNRKFDGTAFIEMRAFGGVKAKREVRRVLRGGAQRNRSTFTGNRGFSPLLRREHRVALFDRAMAFSLRGIF
jgi:hypothetical protein